MSKNEKREITHIAVETHTHIHIYKSCQIFSTFKYIYT